MAVLTVHLPWRHLHPCLRGSTCPHVRDQHAMCGNSKGEFCIRSRVLYTPNTFSQTLEFTNFFIEVPRACRRFWFSLSFCVLMIAGMIILAKASFVPYGWNI